MSTSTDSVTQVILVGLVAGVLFAIFAWRSTGITGRVFFGLVAACLLVPSGILIVGKNPWLIDARFRTFQIFYWNIRVGMSREEVLAEMRNWYPPDQSNKPPTIADDSATKLEFFMTPESTAEPDHEGIVLKMQDGRVMGKEYAPD
ncbi:MAG: hypothetical protein ABIS50_08290 [Luteolibacter sp.]|uniref:hypothetical protein n=1 Tax=Luteolibacter sp. TaxID=1962973 RepID=UPI003267C288